MKALAALAVHLKLFAKYLLFSVVVIGVFQFPEILAKFWSEKIPFQTIKLNPREIKTAPLALEAGHYFVSYGIVRGACDALLNDKVADSNMSEGNGIRSKIMLGHEFIVIKDTPVTLALRCDYQAGFTTSLANEPLVLPAWSGKLIQTYRAFTSVGIGVGSTFFLFVVALFLLIVQGQGKKNPRYIESFIFSIAGLLYLISYCQLPRLWIEGPSATLMHILFRSWFAAGSLVILANYLGKWRTPPLLLIPLSFGYLFFDFNVRTFWPIYQYNYLLFAVVTSVYCVALFKKRDHSKEMQLIRMMGVCWFFSLWWDVNSLFTSAFNYNTPIVMALTCTIFVYLLIYDRFKLEQLELAIKRILAITQSEKPPEKILSEISDVLFNHTKFTRISCYLDTFLLGQSALPGTSVLRVFERGYRKDTSKDYRIEFTSYHGTKMRDALTSQKSTVGKGADGAHFVIIPVGKYIVINLSDDEPASQYQLQLSLDTLERMKHGLAAIENKMNDLGTTGGNLLQRLRSLKKETSFQSEMVGIMLDLHDYSKNCQRYKIPGASINPFAKFISTQYLPGLARAVSGLAYPESLEGDLIAFVVLRDIFESQEEYQNSVSNVLERLLAYKDNAGLSATIANGFEKIQFSIAAGRGSATITMDEYKARASGDALTVSRRILDAAPRESVMIAKDIATEFKLERWRTVSERAILVKKDLVETHLLELINRVDDAA